MQQNHRDGKHSGDKNDSNVRRWWTSNRLGRFPPHLQISVFAWHKGQFKNQDMQTECGTWLTGISFLKMQLVSATERKPAPGMLAEVPPSASSSLSSFKTLTSGHSQCLTDIPHGISALTVFYLLWRQENDATVRVTLSSEGMEGRNSRMHAYWRCQGRSIS